jgi:hypothetical protein
MRSLRFASPIACLLLFFPLTLHAADAPANDPTSHDTLSVEAIAGSAWIRNQSTYEPYAPYFQGALAVGYRASPRVSVGGILGYAAVPSGGGGLHMWRVSGEARYHAIRTRAFDAWAGAELGMAVSTFAPAACGDCASPSGSDAATHVQPLLGAGLGLSVLPISYLSIGLEGRGMVIVFGHADDRESPSGATPAIFAGLTLGVHLPLGP